MTQTATTDTGSTAGRTNLPRPYAPSWIDRLTRLIDRLPGPNWVYYAGIGLAFFLVASGILWAEGVHPIGTLLPIHGFLSGMLVLFPALIHILDGAAARALAALRPVLETDEATDEALRYRLTTLPWHLTLLASLVAFAIAIALNEGLSPPAGIVDLADSPVAYALTYWLYVASWWMWGPFIYHTVHQLRMINRIFADHVRISLFRVQPLYAFSTTTAVTAVSLTIPVYLWLVLNESLRDPISLGITAPVALLGLVAFVWPQLGVRRLLAREKAQLLDALSRRFEAAIVELRRQVDGRETEALEGSIQVFAALEIEEKALTKISTWPWQPETARYLVTALLLPLVLWLVQFLLQRALAP